MVIGFIGAGNLATALIQGSSNSGFTAEHSFAAFDLDASKLRYLEDDFGVKSCRSAQELVSASDAVVLAVKPKDFPSLLSSIGAALAEKDPLIISVAAGTEIKYIRSLLPYDCSIARIMPNINASVGEATTAFCADERVNENQLLLLKEFCSSFGGIFEMNEEMFPIFGVIGGCAPAFAYMFVDQLARAAVKAGMNKLLATKIAAQTVLGSAKLVAESDITPYELVDRVCSPGGTTIEGVLALQECGFLSSVTEAVTRAYEKDCKIRDKK